MAESPPLGHEAKIVLDLPCLPCQKLPVLYWLCDSALSPSSLAILVSCELSAGSSQSLPPSWPRSSSGITLSWELAEVPGYPTVKKPSPKVKGGMGKQTLL